MRVAFEIVSALFAKALNLSASRGASCRVLISNSKCRFIAGLISIPTTTGAVAAAATAAAGTPYRLQMVLQYIWQSG